MLAAFPIYLASFLVLSLVGSTLSHAQDSTPTERLAQLRAATSLNREGLKPWHLKLSFELNDMYGKHQDSGVVEEFWAGVGDQKISVESKLIHGDLGTSETTENQAVAREGILVRALLDETVQPVPRIPQLEVQVLEETRTFGKSALTCLTIVSKSKLSASGASAPQYCVEPANPNVLRAVVSTSQNAVLNRLGRFQNTNVALDNTIAYFGVVAITGKTDALGSFTPTETMAPAANAVPEPKMKASVSGGVIAGSRTGGVNPAYPTVARARRASGSVVLHAVIDASGHITKLVPIASPDEALTEASVDAVKQWTYTPYLLNGTPTSVDTTITVNFSLNQR